jgi:hypothetical protein
MAVHIHPVAIPPRYYKPLGQIAAGWNLTEYLIASIIWHIHDFNGPKEGRLFTYRPMAKQKLDMFKISIKHFAKTKYKDALTAFHQRATDLNTKRNMLIHGLWGRMPKEHKTWKVFFHRDFDDTVLLDRKVMSVDDVKHVAAQVQKLNRDVKKWMAKNRVPPP